MTQQTIELIANDFGTVRIDAEAEVDPDLGSDQILLFGLTPGESVTLTILAGTANPVEGLP